MFCAPVIDTRQPWQRPCMHGAKCVKYGCPYKHPDARPKDCPHGANCLDYSRGLCKLHHPRSTGEIPCAFGLRCDKLNCPFAHDGGATTPTRFRKPCMHGAFCVKFGCGYAHPIGRKKECEFGLLCADKNCTKLHPRASKRSELSIPVTPKFQLGQLVEAQYKNTARANWQLAKVLGVQTSSLTLQFVGWDDAVQIPLGRIRCVGQAVGKTAKAKTVEKTVPPGFTSFISRGAAVASAVASPTAPTSPPKLSRKSIPKAVGRKFHSKALTRLEHLKQVAITEEDFLLANELKQTIQKVNELEIKKASAVRREDFLLAMEIKKQITQLTAQIPASASLSQETKEECDQANQNFNKNFDSFPNKFSLFENNFSPAYVSVGPRLGHNQV